MWCGYVGNLLRKFEFKQFWYDITLTKIVTLFKGVDVFLSKAENSKIEIENNKVF